MRYHPDMSVVGKLFGLLVPAALFFVDASTIPVDKELPLTTVGGFTKTNHIDLNRFPIWGFTTNGIPKKGWLIIENPI